MTTTAMVWWGLGILFLITFLLSLFHASLSTSSKISISRFFEDKDKVKIQHIIDIFDEIRIALESLRILSILAFSAFLFKIFTAMNAWIIWSFLAAFASYFLFFEYLPHLINIRKRKEVLSAFIPLFGFIRAIAAPMLLVLRRLEEHEADDGKPHEATEEEIDTFIDEAREEGIIDKGEDALLRGVVEFGDTVVREIMTPRMSMVCVSRDTTVEQLREVVVSEKYSRIPVYKDKVDNIEGMIIVLDLLEFWTAGSDSRTIEPLIRPVHFIPESMKVSELLKEFQRLKQKLAMVVDEHGGVSGLVTLEDVIEEIVGDIQDEYDVEESRIIETAPGEYMVSGGVEVDDVEKLTGLDLAEEHYVTMSGLITHGLGRLPKRGEAVEVRSLSIDILEVDQKRILKMKIRPPASAEASNDEAKENT